MLAALLLAVIAPADSDAKMSDAVMAKALAATVKIVNVDGSRQGSGTIISAKNSEVHVLTAYHVVANAKKIELHVSTEKGPPKIYNSARVVAGSNETDLAVLLLRSSDKFPEPLPVCPRGKGPRSRSFTALSSGWPKGDPKVQPEAVLQKVLLRRPGEKESIWSYETETKPTPGRSGGPLIDESGRVLGVASGHDGESGFFTHFDEIHRFLRANALRYLFEGDKSAPR